MVGTQVLYKQNNDKGQSYVRRPPYVKGHFYVQGIKFMYHRFLCYKGQPYVKYIKSFLI